MGWRTSLDGADSGELMPMIIFVSLYVCLCLCLSFPFLRITFWVPVLGRWPLPVS